MHTLNLALKNICAAKNTETNALNYEQCNWITEVSNYALIIKHFIMNYSMRLAMFNDYSKDEAFCCCRYYICFLNYHAEEVKDIKRNLQDLILTDRWNMYRDDDGGQTQFVKEKVLDDL